MRLCLNILANCSNSSKSICSSGGGSYILFGGACVCEEGGGAVLTGGDGLDEICFGGGEGECGGNFTERLAVNAEGEVGAMFGIICDAFVETGTEFVAGGSWSCCCWRCNCWIAFAACCICQENVTRHFVTSHKILNKTLHRDEFSPKVRKHILWSCFDL